MTEQEKTSAVVEETRETVETTPQPETTEKTAEKKKRQQQNQPRAERNCHRHCTGGRCWPVRPCEATGR